LGTQTLPQIIKSIQLGVRWLRERAETLTDSRDIAITISALVAAERNPHSTLVQRLVNALGQRQAINGSWNDELWDTTWSTRALCQVGRDVTDPQIQAALQFLKATQDPISGTWYEEPFETMLVLELLATLDPITLTEVSTKPLQWLSSLQKKDGSIIGIRYTAMAASIFHLMQTLGCSDFERAKQSAVKYIRDALITKPIWTSEAWSNYYPLKVLLENDFSLNDSTLRKAVYWFLSTQDGDGKWMQVSRVHDTAMSIMGLSGFLTTPLVTISAPRTGVLNISKENGTMRVSFQGPGVGAMTPIERIKVSRQVRNDLSRNQQLMVTGLGQVRSRKREPKRAASDRTLSLELESAGRYAYGHLIPTKIQWFLQSSPADHLRLDVDEALIDLPWEVLHDGNDFMCLRYALGRRLNSDQSFLQPKRPARRTRETRVLIVADPTGDLPSARKEGMKVASLLRECGLLVDDFPESKISKKDFLLTLKDYDIVHFAGHAYHQSNSPDESYLLFSDGGIMAFEIGRFISSSAPAVVFLNACWSAEELRNTDSYSPMMRGLGRTFLYAGVSSFIGYLVPVPDRSATKFAVTFYEFLLQGQTIGESLRRARIQCRNTKVPNDLTWSSAILYGDPSVRPMNIDT
jgi:CHAT domain-containing protein